MTDTPIQPTGFPPASKSERVKAFIGDLARPFAIYATSAAAAWATVTIAYKVDGFGEAALYIGAVYAGLGALYGAKAWENAKVGKQATEVEVAKVNASPPP